MTKAPIIRTACRILAALAVVFPLAHGSATQARDRVIVGSKIDTEGVLLGHLIILVLEHAGVPVENRLQLGPTKILRTALLSGEVDVYPEYTGNGAFFYNMENDPVWKTSASAYETVRRLDAERHDLVWLDRAPANNTWLIAVRGDLARRERLATMEDYARLAHQAGVFRLAASAEFVESPAALPSFERIYGFILPRDEIVVLPGGDTSVTMRAAAQGISGVNSAMVYGTDGAIAALGLVAMTDPRGAQIVYEPAPVMRGETLRQNPAIGPLLSRVFGSLSMDVLQKLNARITVEGRPPREVARSYLEGAGVLPERASR